jgi:hypothetical protein
MALADGFLFCRGNVDGFQRESNLDEFLANGDTIPPLVPFQVGFYAE